MEAHDDASLPSAVSALIPQFKDLLSRLKELGHSQLEPLTVQEMIASTRALTAPTHWDVSKIDSEHAILYKGFSSSSSSEPSSSLSYSSCSSSIAGRQSNQQAEGILWIFLAAQTPLAEMKPFAGKEHGGGFPGAQIEQFRGDGSGSEPQEAIFSGDESGIGNEAQEAIFSGDESGIGNGEQQVSAFSDGQFKTLSSGLEGDAIKEGYVMSVAEIKPSLGEHGNGNLSLQETLAEENGPPRVGDFLSEQTKRLSNGHGNNGAIMESEESVCHQIKPEAGNGAQIWAFLGDEIKRPSNSVVNENGRDVGTFDGAGVKPSLAEFVNRSDAQIDHSSLSADIKPKTLCDNTRNENGTQLGDASGPDFKPFSGETLGRTMDDLRPSKVPDFVLGCIKAPPPPSHPLTQLVSAIMDFQSRSRGAHSPDVFEPDFSDLIPHLPFVGAFIYQRVGNDGQTISSTDHLAAKFSQILGFEDPKICGVCLVGSTITDPPYLAFMAGMNGYDDPLLGLATPDPFNWLNRVSVDVAEPNAPRDCLEEYVQQALEAGEMVPGCAHSLMKQEESSRSIHLDFKLGDDFPTIDDLKEKLRAACLEKHVEFYVVKSSRSKYTVRCRNPGCGWRMHASILGTGPTCRIRALADHTCEGAPGLGNKNASAQWIAQKLQEKIKQHPNYRPVDIIRDLQREEGIQIPYARAWRGKEAAMISIHGDELKGYCMLPGYLTATRAANPGSVALMECKGATFYRLFLAYSACLRGFKCCRPLVAFDATQLTGKYQGCLLTATGLDARDQLFPIASAVVDIENEENWMWFMTTLRQCLQLDTCILTLISHREKGLLEAGAATFPESKHAYCMRHLVERLKKDYTSNGEFIKLIWSAAHQASVEKFEEVINAARVLCPEGVQYMLSIDPAHWATAHFPGRRWGHLTTNVAESVNSWLQEARPMPIIAMLESIRKQLAEWFFQRRQEAEAAVSVPQFDTSTLIQPVDEKIREAIASSQHYLVRPSDLTVFEIDTGKQTRIVNLDGWDCSCKEWQIYGIPCSHACAAILFRGDQCQMYADRCFSIEAYKESYESPIYPIDMQSIVMENVLPPETRRPPGRPRKRPITAAELEENTRPFTCSRCGMQQRHNRRTCKNPVKYNEGNYMIEGPVLDGLPPQCESTNTTALAVENGDVMAPHGGGMNEFGRGGYGRGRGRGRGRGHSNIHPQALNA